jgi:Ricin-type beta-trefoil lectin domain-like
VPTHPDSERCLAVSAGPAHAGLQWLKFPMLVNQKVPAVIGATGRVIQQPYNGSTYQQWRYIHYGNWASLQNRATGLCLDVGGTDTGADVFVATCDETFS